MFIKNFTLMKKKSITCAWLLAAALLLPWTSAHAQNVDDDPSAIVPSPAIRQQVNAGKVNLAKEYPLLYNRMTLKQRKTDGIPSAYQPEKPIVVPHVSKAPSKAALAAADSADIWANVLLFEEWGTSSSAKGIYSFKPTNPIKLTEHKIYNSYNMADYGVEYTGGHMYGLTVAQTSNNTFSATWFDYNPATGQARRRGVRKEYFNALAMETAQATDGTLWGEFLTADLRNVEIGTADYSRMSGNNATPTRTSTIGPAHHIYVAMGITSKGELYGIASNGNLYKISTVDASETLIGATGVSLLTSAGRYYQQTGEIDPTTDTFYWYSINSNGISGLYTVDLTTGKATLVSDTQGQMVGMFFPRSDANDGAPAAPTGVKLSVSGTNLTASVSFTMPSKTYKGDALSGTLNYTIKGENGHEYASGTAQAGASVTANVTAAKSNLYTFNVRAVNAEGTSPKASVTGFLGFDQPRTPSSIRATASGTNVNVSWSAPSRGVNNGNVGTVTYTVRRVEAAPLDTVTVATDITATSFTDALGARNYNSYTYLVTAKNAEQTGVAGSSNAVNLGNPIEPDWKAVFAKANALNVFSQENKLNDGKTWSVWEYWQGAQSPQWTYKPSDYWLYTPGVHMKPGQLYVFEFEASQGNNIWYNNPDGDMKQARYLEVSWGKAANSSAMKDTLMKPTAIRFAAFPDWINFRYEVKVEEEGTYYFGFHDISPTDTANCIRIHSVAINNGPLLTSPDSVKSLTLIPDAEGWLKAALTFTLPSTDINGKAIEKVDSVVIKRDGEKIATIAGGAAGTKLTYNDNTVPTNDTHKYEVFTYAGDKFGRSAFIESYIGQDAPPEPSGFNITDNNNDNYINASWKAFGTRGANGGKLIPSRVRVQIGTYTMTLFGYEWDRTLLTSGYGATSLTMPLNTEEALTSDGKSQSFYSFAAKAEGDAGESDFVVGNSVIFGPTINLPFKESDSENHYDNGFVWSNYNNQVASRVRAAAWFRTAEVNSQDNDGGCFAYYAVPGTTNILPGDAVSLNMPKISIKNAANPYLYFYVYTQANEAAKLNVHVILPGRLGYNHNIKSIDLSEYGEGWHRIEADLSAFKNNRYVIPGFEVVSEDTTTYLALDNINIIDRLQNDMQAMKILVQRSVDAGKTADVKVTVQNLGAQTANSYKVVLYANNVARDTVVVTKPLASLDVDTVTLKLATKHNESGSFKLTASVIYDGDGKSDNNTTAAKEFIIDPSEYAKVVDLAAKEAANNAVELKWTEPTRVNALSVVEGFESYDPNDFTIGDWKTINGDGGYNDAIMRGYAYPGQGTQAAYVVFNPSSLSDKVDLVASNPGMKPFDGNQYVVAFYATKTQNGNEVIDANRWLISPRLSGKQQTISFNVLNLVLTGSMMKESFEVLYSTTNTDTTSFKKVMDGKADGTRFVNYMANWKNITAQLPEGAKYFAIRCNSDINNHEMFGIDDITYEKAPQGYDDRITGYVVYRDGEVVDTVKGSTLTYLDTKADAGSHVYNVTVLYTSSDGIVNESDFSNDATITVVTAIDEIAADENNSYTVTTLDGITLMRNAQKLNLSKLQQGVYIINGKKYIIRK